tara:strand:- start:245 stop:994 length:750 start_codon:yes stop_codon:yes gene_type:complete
MIFFHKILPVFINPLFIVVILILISIFYDSIYLRVAAFTVLCICSNPVLGFYSISYLEKDYPPMLIKDSESHETVVVLSGMIKKIKYPDGTIRPEFSGSIDRFEAGLALIKAGKARKVIFTRGQLPWSIGLPEGEYLRKLAIDRGVDPSLIVLSEVAANTYQESIEVSKIVPLNEKIILVTSAYHMKRAQKLFSNQGIITFPFPVDYQTGSSPVGPNKYLPSVDALVNTSLFVRELAGRLYYNLKILLK